MPTSAFPGSHGTPCLFPGTSSSNSLTPESGGLFATPMWWNSTFYSHSLPNSPVDRRFAVPWHSTTIQMRYAPGPLHSACPLTSRSLTHDNLFFLIKYFYLFRFLVFLFHRPTRNFFRILFTVYGISLANSRFPPAVLYSPFSAHSLSPQAT
jgi:hypothetical protein